MSVPLDRLYNFLHDVCNRDDLIIYRFFPHGSRKLEDVQPLRSDNRLLILHKNYIFCHDQEPLNFDLYNEIDVNDLDAIKHELKYLDEHNIEKYKQICKQVMPKMNLKWAAGLIGAFEVDAVLIHSEKRSPELKKYKDLEFIPVYWWSHGLIALDWFRYAEIDPALNKKNIKQDFLIYNRAWSGTREYRIKFADLLSKHKLHQYCLTWFSEIDNNQHYLNHTFVNPKFSTKNSNLPFEFPSSQANSNSSADYVGQDYQNTRIEVVLETLFDDSRLHLTEKILRPIACGQPFILASTHGSLEYLRSYGFETFSEFINETYDTIPDALERLEAIVAEMSRISHLPDVEKENLYQNLDKIAQRNKKLFFSMSWQQQIVDEFRTNMNHALTTIDQINHSLTGQ